MGTGVRGAYRSKDRMLKDLAEEGSKGWSRQKETKIQKKH